MHLKLMFLLVFLLLHAATKTLPLWWLLHIPKLMIP